MTFLQKKQIQHKLNMGMGHGLTSPDCGDVYPQPIFYKTTSDEQEATSEISFLQQSSMKMCSPNCREKKA